jgi:HEAT repeat protein
VAPKPTSPGRPKRALGRLTLILLALLALFATRSLWTGNHPASAAARNLRVSEVSERILAIRDLERFGPEDPEVAIPALTTALSDPDSGVRTAAAMALFTATRGGGNSRSAQAAVRRAVVALLDCLKDPASEVRARSAEALWMIASQRDGSGPVIDPSRVEKALTLAASDPDASTRRTAVFGLGAIGSRVAEAPPPVLVAALEDPSENVRAAAAESLAMFRQGLPRLLPALVQSFENARPEIRSGYATVFRRIRPRASSITRTHSKDAPHGDDPVLAAAEALERIVREHPLSDAPPPSLASDSFQALLKVLRSGTPPVRAAVAIVLGRFLPTPDVIPVLGESVHDTDPSVRAAALRALHDIGNRMPFVPPDSVGTALEDDSPQVRYWAAGALGHAGRGIDPFVTALLWHAEHDPEAEVRAVCAFELRDCIKPPAVTPAVVPALTEALKSNNQLVCSAACGMLATFGAKSTTAIPTLIGMLRRGAVGPGPPAGETSSPDQVSWTATALGAIAPGTAQAEQAATALLEIFEAEASRGEPIALIEALARFGPLVRGAVPRLRELEQGSNKALSETARKALASLKDAHEKNSSPPIGP